MKPHKFDFKELPIEQVEEDQNQPRRNFGTEGDENRLLVSIREYGIEEPLKVSQIEDKRYLIIDGHRRYKCAQKLGRKTVPCRVYPKMPEGEFEARRFEIQNNRRSWKPMERSQALERIKAGMGFKTNHELAKFIHMNETLVASLLQLRKVKMEYLEMMVDYRMRESYRMEFVRLKPKIRKIKDIEASDIIKIIFEKVQHKVITTSKDFRKLGRVFLRATANEAELHHFLKNPDMTVDELEQRTLQSGFSLLIEQLIQKVTEKRRDGVAFSSQEKTFLKQLLDLLKKAF